MADSSAFEYEVTATRRRPKTFDELAGQEFVVSTLRNSLAGGRIAHAYLFSGPRGCGKTSAARILARSVNCVKAAEAGYDGNPCGVCDNCVAISRGASMDVIEIDGASNTGVNDVRQIQDEVLFPPQTGRYKVYIIDEVHMLSNSAFNAFLKTIEEPPPYIIFIFATTELHKVPATIKSRCQQFNFRLIPIETIQEILKKVCAEMEIEAEDDALFWIARESTGSLRDAFTLFDQVVSFSGGHIRESLIREKLGLVGLEKLNALAEACAANDTPGAFALLDEILGSGIAVEQCITDLASYYRSLLLLKNGITRESLLGYRANLFSAKVPELLDNVRLEQALELLLDCYRNVRYSVSPRFELETAVSKLAWLSRWVSPDELKAALDGARNVLRGHSSGVGSVSSAGAGMPQQSGATLPLAGGAPRNTPETASAGNADSKSADKGSRSLSADFKSVLAARAGGAKVPSSGGETNYSASDDAEEEDVPLWSGMARDGSGQKPESQIDPQVEKVLQIIPGTLVTPSE